MSAYKLIEVVKNSEREVQGIYDFEDFDAAIAAIHNDFGVAVKQDTTIAVYCTLINQTTGVTEYHLYWDVNENPVDETQEPVSISIRERVYTHNDFQDDNIAAYDSAQLAIGNFHTKYSAAISNVECHFAMAIRLNGQGVVKDFELYRT